MLTAEDLSRWELDETGEPTWHREDGVGSMQQKAMK
jgi:hypothetical protein